MESHDIQKNCNIVPISAEELKIRSELGMEIEKDLEEEIKEGIYHLALRLHRIYQERKEKSAKETFEPDNNRARALSEVNISIRMEGRTKVEIKEVNNEEAVKKGCPYSRPQNVREVKKVDWVKTLRGGSSPVCASRLSSVSSKNKEKKHSTDPNGLSNWKIPGGRGKKAGSFGEVKQNAGVEKEILQLGWRYGLKCGNVTEPSLTHTFNILSVKNHGDGEGKEILDELKRSMAASGASCVARIGW
ncbi:unnamed protein product [Sphenostylis stenocarpa]|uniref:Uncharacterized protein n=1 Tax=Sphenostylis stenocarpa TaxID=92480 RepID=A0AA86V4I2_9FABA|nr:unnamed protein product [Sphenostylis stenocarpa]